MKLKNILLAAVAGITFGCTPQNNQDCLPSWNETPVKQRILNFLQVEAEKIPLEDRIAVFDMDGTLVCERPFGIETVVSIHRLLEQGEQNPSLKETIEYQYAKKLKANPHDETVLNNRVVDGENVFANIIMKPFDGADCEEYIQFANKCLNTAVNTDYGLKYADMFYQPMLELVDALREKQFQVFIVSASMQGIVWSICPQVLGLDRLHLMGIRHSKKVAFQKGGPIAYTIENSRLEPVNDYKGKAINIYDHIGKVPVVAVGNTYSDFGMFKMVSCSPYPNLSVMLNHDDAEREYVYSPTHGRNMNWQDSLAVNNWLQVDMSKEFKVVWKK